MSVLSLVSSVVLSICYPHGARPALWGAMFYIGGLVVVFVACMLVMIRWDEHTRYAAIDRVALVVAAVTTVVFIIMCLEFRSVKNAAPNHRARVDAGLAALFASGHRWPGATQHGR